MSYCTRAFMLLSNTYANNIKLRGEAQAYKTSLAPPLFFIEVPVPSQESERSCICVIEVSILQFHLLFFYCTLELFNLCDIFMFFILYQNYCIKIDIICFRLTASDVMSKKVVVFYPATRVSSIIRILKTNAHNAFPVVTVKDKTTEVITNHILLCVCILSKRQRKPKRQSRMYN